MGDQRWSIGQLARASGVTVRTLHYYDQIGLVSPGERTAAGHRRYVEADVRRLYRVRPAPAPHARRGLRRHRDHVQRWAGLHPPPDPGRATGHTTISYEDVAPFTDPNSLDVLPAGRVRRGHPRRQGRAVDLHTRLGPGRQSARCECAVTERAS